MDGQPAREQWGPLARFSFAAGGVVIAVSVGLFIHTISQLASPIVCAAPDRRSRAAY
jgi:hypothetical protein